MASEPVVTTPRTEESRVTHVPGTLSVFGAPPSTVDVLVERRSVGRRAGRALAAWAVSWALAFAAVFVPVLHFVLVPGFLVLGVVLAVREAIAGTVVTAVRGPCPRCDGDRAFPASGRLRSRKTVDCPHCHHDLELRIEPFAP